MNQENTPSTPHLELWSASWCGDCRRTKHLLDAFKLSYIDHDVDEDTQAATTVEEMNEKIRGTRMGSIPVLRFLDDETYMIEPSNEEMLRKLLRLQLITREQVSASTYPLPNGAVEHSA